MLEGWFKTEKMDEFKKRTLEEQEKVDLEKEKLQEIIDTKIDDQQKFFELTNNKFKASQTPDDQELNNAAMAEMLNKKLEEAPLVAHETELEMKIHTDIKDDEIGSNYATKN